ncbi:MAG: hypothetical protein A2Y07_06785 [Planctomycetes bacterium GWF2_50_10]|nr:MAG: hypothetical protein A2Y07_06785 [Planctomycetes bacterium GWF2_50_10]
MASFWSQNFDYLYFVYGLSFVLLASICIILRRADRTIAWQWLGLFGIVHGINEWLDMLAISVGDSFYFKLTRLVIMALSYVFLLEFARRWYNRNRPAIAAYWYIFPLLILLAIGFVDRNINWFNAASRYVLGFAGSLLAGFVLLKTACPADCKRRFGVILAAGSFLTYALATGLVVPKAAIFPATCLNYDSFFAVCGFPVQLIRMLCALTAMTGLWLYLPRPVNETASQRILHKLVSPAIFIIVILLGWFATEWRGKSLDSDLRDRLLMDTMSIAGTISPEQVKQL